MQHARLPRRFVVFILAYAGAAVASMGAWALIGGAALEGRFDAGTLLAWSFLLLSIVPLAIFAMWAQGVFMVGLSGILKMKLMAGALKLDPDETRSRGVGQNFARVLDSNALEALALAGGFSALTAIFDLALGASILMITSQVVELIVLLMFVAAMVAVGFIYFRRRQQWTAARLLLTHALVEQMVGHRTRLVQASHWRGHEDEDEALSRYVDLSKRMDRAAVVLSLGPRAYLVVGLAMLAPRFMTGGASVTTLAVALGILLLASNALVKLLGSLTTLVDAAVSWNQVAPLLEALQKPELHGHVELAGESVSRMRESRNGPLVAAQDLAFRFRSRADTVLSGCGFRIAAGDRIHLTGPSGAAGSRRSCRC